MDPDDICPVEDYSPETLAMLSDMLERSISREHLVYREAELDDLWRVVDTALSEARRDSRAGERAAQLEELRALTMRVHDLVGSDERPREGHGSIIARFVPGIYAVRHIVNIAQSKRLSIANVRHS